MKMRARIETRVTKVTGSQSHAAGTYNGIWRYFVILLFNASTLISSSTPQLNMLKLSWSSAALDSCGKTGMSNACISGTTAHWRSA